MGWDGDEGVVEVEEASCSSSFRIRVDRTTAFMCIRAVLDRRCGHHDGKQESVQEYQVIILCSAALTSPLSP